MGGIGDKPKATLPINRVSQLESGGTILTDPKGVALNAPPWPMFGGVINQVEKAIADLPPNVNGAFVAIADLSGVNGSVVTRGPLGFKVEIWVGKKWDGPIEGGARVVKTW
jgi:hypothetical protein